MLKKEKIVVLMRHGERADLAGAEVKCNYSDPELTEVGKNQAYTAGKRLRSILEDMLDDKLKKIDASETMHTSGSDLFSDLKIALISSPFSRTLETTIYAKNGMGLNGPIYIENGLSEFISYGWFKNSPKNFLCYQQLFHNNEESNESDLAKRKTKMEKVKIKKPEYFLNQMMNEILIYQSLYPLPEFPESTNKCISRFQTTLDLILYYYGIRKDYNIIIMVSHVFGIQALCEKMEIPMDYFEIEYCSTFIFRFDTETGKFTFNKNFYPISF